MTADRWNNRLEPTRPVAVVDGQHEFTHAVPDGIDARSWADTLWLDINDPAAGICGIMHWHLGLAGLARAQLNVVVDGVALNYVNKFAFDGSPYLSSWTDGKLTYRVDVPLREVSVSFDGPRYGLDLVYRRRFPFDPVSRPLLAMGAQTHDGGHYEQPMWCSGTLELRDGPSKGLVREIGCPAFRDHTWSDRWSQPLPWAGDESREGYGHYWPAFYLPDRHIQGWGMYRPTPAMSGTTTGGFEASASGQRLLRKSSAEYDSSLANWRDVRSFVFELEMEDGEIVHIVSGRSFGIACTYHLDLHNDVESRVDQFANFCEISVPETGERGTGTIEYSLVPSANRWLS